MVYKTILGQVYRVEQHGNVQKMVPIDTAMVLNEMAKKLDDDAQVTEEDYKKLMEG